MKAIKFKKRFALQPIGEVQKNMLVLDKKWEKGLDAIEGWKFDERLPVDGERRVQARGNHNLALVHVIGKRNDRASRPAQQRVWIDA